MRNARKGLHHLATRGIVCSLCLIAVVARPVRATVLEYDAAGKVSVTETQIKNPALDITVASPRSPRSVEIRELTRSVAVQYAGSVGVRNAGLNALTFIEVFTSLIERESAFKPFVVSDKGAKGLGQLMPKTAEDMGVTNPFDPKANLIGSAKYFTKLLQRFGKLELALAAYNAGPERVKQYGGIPPFQETKAYIAWIIKRAGIERPKQDKPIQVSAPSPRKFNTQIPLKGETSVWEF